MSSLNRSKTHCERSVEELALDVALYGRCPSCQTRHSYRSGDKLSAEAIGCDHYFHVALFHLQEHTNPSITAADKGK